MNYSNLEKVSAIPEAASMIESFRSFGYSVETAVADIIDNCISANAKNIYFNSIWDGDKSYITITDDGIGMNNEEIIQAMKPGTQNPLARREENDLGRFGLGLKTASFSQCRTLSVLSRKKNCKKSYWTWDLDYVNKSHKWELLKYIPDLFNNGLDNSTNGTIVVWSNLDRLIPSGTPVSDINSEGNFLEIMEKIKQHIAMTFHRFLQENKINIFFWEKLISPWDPFLSEESATQIFPTDYISLGATMKGYVLPHKSKIDEKTYKMAEGFKGWGEQQGFYVYRGKRLLLAGDWLGLFRKEEHYKLVRIRIDLPNTLDADWQIDIKKSTARPPLVNREQLKAYAMKIRQYGSDVFRHRGRIIKQRAGQEFESLWLDKKKGNKWYFIINRDHSLVKKFKEQAKEEPEKAIDLMLKFIEETLPSKTIFIKESEQGNNQKLPFNDSSNIILLSVMKEEYDNQIKNGKTPEEAKQKISTIEPFNNYPELIDNL
ncbi:MAG: ATP-binding protein [Bacteroidales bacterium]